MSTDAPTTTPHAPEEDSGTPDEEVAMESDREPATIAHYRGERRGVAIYLTAEDLRQLGIPRDVDTVVPSILNGAVLIKPTK